MKASPPLSSALLSALLEPLNLLMLVLGLAGGIYAGVGLPVYAVLAVLEVIYLVGMAANPAYRRRVNLKVMQGQQETREKLLEQQGSSLRREHRRRYQSLFKLYQETANLLRRNESASTALDLPATTHDQLMELLESGLEVSQALQSIQDTLSKNDPATLKLKVNSQTSAGPEGAQARAIMLERLEQLERLQTGLPRLEGRLQVIEQTLLLLKEQLGSQQIATLEAERLEQVVTEVRATQQTLRELRALESAAQKS